MATDPWAGFEHDPRRPENAALRASDRDRDVVHRVLGEAYAEGRLDRGELDERSEATVAARTLGELPALVSDLVPARAVVPVGDRHARAVAEQRAELRHAVWGFVSASVICWAIWLATGWGDGLGSHFPWPLFVMLGTGLRVGRVATDRDARVAEVERRLEKEERKALERDRAALEERPAPRDTED